MGELLYSYGTEWFTTNEPRKEVPMTTPKSRRQLEIEGFIKEKRDLRKCRRKSSLEERVGINLSLADLKERLERLRRAENIRTPRKRKERARIPSNL